MAWVRLWPRTDGIAGGDSVLSSSVSRSWNVSFNLVALILPLSHTLGMLERRLLDRAEGSDEGGVAGQGLLGGWGHR